MHIELGGKLALICASTRGLGFACASSLIKAGSSVIITGRSGSRLSEARQELLILAAECSSDPCVHALEVDLDDRESFNDFLYRLNGFPDIDILVANSGGPAPGDFNSFTSVEDFEEKCSRITFPATSLIKYVLPKMRKKNGVV